MSRRGVIVGAGLMGRWHGVYARRSGVRIAAVVDRDPGAARALAARFPGARPFAAGDDWLAATGAHGDGDGDGAVVHVCTPLESHREVAEAALAAGRHTLVEKPLTATAAELRELLDLARRRRRRLAAVHQLPLQRGVVALRRRLPQLGELTAVSYTAFTAGAEGRDAAGRREVMLEILPHPLSLFRALGLGGVDVGTWRAVRWSDDDLLLATDRGPALLTVHLSCRARPTRHRLWLAGSRGTAEVDLYHGFATFEPGSTGRWPKIRLPFLTGTGLLAAATSNLLRRALHRQPAYPGLPELLRTFYRSLDAPEGPVDAAGFEPAELLEAAELVDRLRRIP